MFAWLGSATEVVRVDDLFVDAIQHLVERSLHTLICHFEDLLGHVIPVAALDENNEVGPG